MKAFRFICELLAYVAIVCCAGYADEGKSPARLHLASKTNVAVHGHSAGTRVPKPMLRRPAAPPAPKLRPLRQPVTTGAPDAPPVTVRRRNSNPAIISGSAEVTNRNTGSLDGRQIHRRP